MDSSEKTGYIRKPQKLHFYSRSSLCLGVRCGTTRAKGVILILCTDEQYYGKVGVPILKQDRLMWRRALGTYDELAFFKPLDQASAAALYAWFSWIRGFLPFLTAE